MEEKKFETENTEELNELMRDRIKEREASAGESAENAENTENAENIEKVENTENTENTELLYAARCHIGARETAVLADQYSRKFTIGFAVAVPIIFLCLAWLLGFSDNDMIFGIVMCVLAAVSVPLAVFGFPALVRRNSLKNTPMLGADSEVLVTKDKIFVRVLRDERVLSSFEYAVRDLLKVVSYRGLFLVYLNKMQACMMDQNCFTKGSPDECLAFFASCNIPVFGQKR